MGHELSHILLHSLRHKERENEFYTDLTPLVLGFAEIVKDGRTAITNLYSQYSFQQTTRYTETTTFGYLTDQNFNMAYSQVMAELGRVSMPKRLASGKILVVSQSLECSKRMINLLKRYLDQLARRRHLRMTIEDARKISSFHQLGYLDEYRSMISHLRVDLDSASAQLVKIKHYTNNNLESISRIDSSLQRIENMSKSLLRQVEADTRFCEKHLNLFQRIFVKLS